ncbi:MAG: hypothetical protein LWX83_09415 [Anaerolineae bacterium]|nr:hypothetical protein [Anaerolineae bacterium]
MKTNLSRVLYWTPRILSILFILFISLFALDVFNEGYDPWQTFVGLTIHLIPSYILIAAAIIAWRWEPAGVVVYALMTGVYPLMVGSRAHWSVYLIMSGIPLLLAVLYLLDWMVRTRVQRQAAA